MTTSQFISDSCETISDAEAKIKTARTLVAALAALSPNNAEFGSHISVKTFNSTFKVAIRLLHDAQNIVKREKAAMCLEDAKTLLATFGTLLAGSAPAANRDLPTFSVALCDALNVIESLLTDILQMIDGEMEDRLVTMLKTPSASLICFVPESYASDYVYYWEREEGKGTCPEVTIALQKEVESVLSSYLPSSFQSGISVEVHITKGNEAYTELLIRRRADQDYDYCAAERLLVFLAGVQADALRRVLYVIDQVLE